ncbi:MAG: transporter substrate-binding domain-containing protein [Candidatus Nanoarchaeia archaeon]|nr:transporter substrate-binding domain-containing protein [Candidatus Nanoarchaeia archaeon]
MYKIFFLIIFLFIYPINLFANIIEVELYHDESYPPYAYVNENNESSDIYVDLLKIVDEKLEDYTFKFVPISWSEGIKKLESGEILALFPPYFRPDERPWVDYSIFLMEEGLVAVINRNFTELPIEPWPQSFKNKTIGVNKGFNFPVIREFQDRNIYEVVDVIDNLDGVRKLRDGVIDVYVNDILAILFTEWQMRARNEELPHSRIVMVLAKEMAFLAISKNNDSEYVDDLISKLSQILFDMRFDGKIDDVTIDYFLNNR